MSTTHVHMHPLTRRFSSPALEHKYRGWLFAWSHTYLGVISAIAVAMQICSYAEGQATLSASVTLILSQNAPHIARVVIYRRGDRHDDACRFRMGFLVYDILLLFAKLNLPTLFSSNVDGDDDVGRWLFAQPLSMALQGPDARHSWLLSMIALVMSHSCDAWSIWRGNQQADGVALRAAVMAGECFAYMVDWGLRTKFLRRAEARACLVTAVTS